MAHSTQKSSPLSIDSKGHCRVCGTKTTLLCSRCHTACYCSREHIVEDWRRHKAECQAISTLAEAQTEKPEKPGSTTEVLDAILFAVNEQKPRMIKVQVDTMPGDEYDMPWKKLRAEPWFSKTPLAADTSRIGTSVRSLLVGRQWSNGPPLEHGLSLCIRYDENFLINKSKNNRCIQHLTNGKALHPWAGNFYVVRTDGFQEHNYFSANMAEDLPALKKYFETYGR
ncbi:hypothetical protein BDP27DRAFT_1223743 [Rhodocollybia butyracea]|uniref:MYND-type domain-containing protein n=1 Tax=Rhodocollybia butyracea TaxID=206335 RepID=A0A9P5PST1_9AGAR|nr:hypothetical protein BDP27DRAFT_1223743 [Rhodocollybia butyracea]